ELVGFAAMPAGVAAAKAAVATAFQNAFSHLNNVGKEKIKLGADVSISQISPSDPDRWVVHSADVTYLLKKKATAVSFIITKQSLTNMKSEGVPDEVLAKQESIKNREVIGEENFQRLLNDTIGEEQTVKFKKVILKHAATANFFAEIL